MTKMTKVYRFTTVTTFQLAAILMTLGLGLSASSAIPARTALEPITAAISTQGIPGYALVRNNAPSASERLKLDVTPAHQFAPGTIQLKIRVEPNAENRVLCFGFDSGSNYGRTSCQDLEGDKAPTIHLIRYKDLPSGDYEAFAQLLDNTKVIAQVIRTFTILSSDSTLY